MPIVRNTELQGRFLHRDEAGVKPLTDAQISELNKQYNILDELGIPLDREGDITNSNGVPRMFFTTPRENMSDGARSAKEVGIQVGSKEFWRQVQLGNVFVYPVGQKGPSQLQVSIPATGEPTVAASKEIKSELSMPERKIEKPGFFTRYFLRIFSAKAREQVRSYDNQVYSNYGQSVKLHLSKRSSDVLNREVSDLNTAKAKKEAEAYQQAHGADYEKASKLHSNRSVCEENIDRLYGLKPDPRESWKNAHASGEVLDNLKKDSFDLNMGKITSKHLKKPFTDEDFTTMAFFTSTEKKIMEDSAPYKQHAEDKPRERDILMNCGISKEDADYLVADAGSNVAFTDYCDLIRSSSGNQSIPHIVQPARKKTKEAFEAYGRGDKKPLAALVASAVKRAAIEHCRIDVERGAKTFGDKTDAGVLLQTSKLAEVINKDPQLLEIAKKEYGMKDGDLNLVNGLAEYQKLDDARTAALKKLATAEKFNEPLPEEEKKQCIKDIVKAELACQIIADQKNGMLDLKENAQVKDISDKILGCAYDPKAIQKGSPIKETQPEGTMITMTAHLYGTFNVPALLCKRPEFASSLKADSPALDAQAEIVMKQEKLYEPGKSEEELFKKIDKHIYSAESMKTAAQEYQKAKDAPQKEIKGPDINDRKKMFEPKQPGGPTA